MTTIMTATTVPVAEIGEHGPCDRIVAHFTEWEPTGRLVPEA